MCAVFAGLKSAQSFRWKPRRQAEAEADASVLPVVMMVSVKSELRPQHLLLIGLR